MKDFLQWLVERGARTGLGIYPALYSKVGTNPPLDSATVGAGHLNAFAYIHGGEHPELLSPSMRKEWEKNKKKAPRTMGNSKNPWSGGFAKTEK